VPQSDASRLAPRDNSPVSGGRRLTRGLLFVKKPQRELRFSPGRTEGLSTKIVAAFKGVLGDSSFGNFEADGSLPLGNLVQSGTRNGTFPVFATDGDFRLSFGFLSHRINSGNIDEMSVFCYPSPLFRHTINPMKSLMLGLLTTTLLLTPAMAVFADGNSQNYTVQKGDSLWEIAESQLGSPWCWTLIASIPENDLDYQGLLYAGDTITLPSVEDCNAIIHSLSVDAPQVSETVLVYLPNQPWHEKNLVIGDYIERTYRDVAHMQSYSKYDDMDVNDPSLYRERDGNIWYVVHDSERGQAWDYVDHVLKNDATGSVFYRARDIRGEWYIVKNEVVTKLSFEPKELYLNPSLDDVFAFTPPYSSTTEQNETHLWSPIEEWTIPVKAVPVAVDPIGHVLFRAEKTVAVHTLNADGTIIDVCSSSVCSFEYTYWLNGKQVASATSQMVPMFSDSDVPVKKPFFYESAEKAFKYYGVFGRPSFDDAGNLVFYVVTDTKVTKRVYEVK